MLYASTTFIKFEVKTFYFIIVGGQRGGKGGRGGRGRGRGRGFGRGRGGGGGGGGGRR